jgi:hypothetical protein
MHIKEKGGVMEAVMQIIKADLLMPFMKIPESMRHSRVRVFITSLEDEEEEKAANPKINKAVWEKFADPARHEEFITDLREKQARGIHFDFDVQKLIDGTETEEDRQKRFRAEKRCYDLL